MMKTISGLVVVAGWLAVTITMAQPAVDVAAPAAASDVFLPAMNAAGPVPGLANAFDGLTVNGHQIQLQTVGDLATMLEALQAGSPTPNRALPRNRFGMIAGSGFWSLQNPDWPPLPGDIYGLPAYQIGNGQMILADQNFDYAAPPVRVKSKLAQAVVTADAAMNAPAAGVAVNYGTNLWIAQTAVSNLNLNAIGTNTIADVQYEIQSRTNLNQTDWQSEGFILGSETANWTPFGVAQNNRTNLFLRLRSWQDDGSGLPLWWQLQYFGATGVDPYGNPAGDGYSNYYKFEHGMDPFVSYPAPPIIPPDLSANAYMVNGASGSLYLILKNAPSDLRKVRVARVGTYYSFYASAVYDYLEQNLVPNIVSPLPDGTFEIDITNFVNGICKIPDSQSWQLYPYYFQIQYVLADSVSNNFAYPETDFDYDEQALQWRTPFIDLRRQLKDNLVFLLRAASYEPFNIQCTDGGGSTVFQWSTNYAVSSCYGSGLSSAPLSFDCLRPLNDNFIRKNFVFDPNNLAPDGLVNTGCLLAGVYTDEIHYFYILYPVAVSNYPAYYFNETSFLLASNWTAPASQIPPTGSQWILPGGHDAFYGYNGWILSSSYTNCYGLHCASIENADANGGPLVLSTTYPGQATPSSGSGVQYYNFVQPSLALANYYFGRANLDPMPESYAFITTNSSPAIFQGVGSRQQVAGYAKFSLSNGAPNKFAYLGQYFDQACHVDASGNVTTNTTGVLSPYGHFFATEPGDAALVTLPDIDTGQRGTGIVHCVSLNVDKNHDGVMDLTFNGTDATSQNNPMVWWINDDYDYSGASWNYGNDVQPSWYYNDGYQQKIDSQRDLEDYARLWICGMPALTNGNYQVTLSWANVSSGNPTINLFETVETNGGIGYLTNLDTATAEAYNYGIWGENRRAIAQISPGQPFTFPAGYFTNAGDKHFLFDGAITNGAGELLLRISQNGNTIAQTGVWLDLHDVRDFYERAVITNNMSSSAISNWTSGIEMVQPATASALDDDTNLIVLVHGFNVANSDWLIQSDTVFKRLYWAGYHGKFMTVKWPCEPLTAWNAISENTAIFNNSEIKSYKAGTALKDYLSQLKTRFPNYPLNVLAHSQGNAIMGEAIEQGAPFDTYILTQGAMPASSYDVNAPTDSTLLTAETLVHTPEWKPMGYHGVYTNFAALTGKIVSYYNSFDPVLDWWTKDQAAGKPNGYANHVLSPLASYYSFDGVTGWWNGILYGLFSSYQVTDPQESRAMISRSRTLPIGQTGPESSHGVIQSGIDLHAYFNFSNTSFADHSAQWAWPIQTTLPYYKQILTDTRPAL